MFTKRMALHEGGHGHEGCCGQHSHEHAHEHVSGHHHEHGDTPELTPEQTLALMSYMLDHNRSHAEELHGVAPRAGAPGQARGGEARRRGGPLLRPLQRQAGGGPPAGKGGMSHVPFRRL
ncbi:MAG: hypothetical protein ACLTSG_09485 [Lachnospiraceae bacterium]